MKVQITLEIENCQAHCPWYCYSSGNSYCNHPEYLKEIDDNFIPEDCPLLKYEVKDQNPNNSMEL